MDTFANVCGLVLSLTLGLLVFYGMAIAIVYIDEGTKKRKQTFERWLGLIVVVLTSLATMFCFAVLAVAFIGRI